MTKPDRFERALATERYDDSWGIPCVTTKAALRLLRREHAWFRRMVRQEAQRALDETPSMGDGDVIENILRRLDQRRK